MIVKVVWVVKEMETVFVKEWHYFEIEIRCMVMLIFFLAQISDFWYAEI